MTIPVTDLKAQYANIKTEVDEAVSKVMESGGFILGPEVKKFEEEMASYCGTSHGIGVGSGTEALHLALLACGIGPGDEVITPSFTFIATAEVIVHCGATPVFVDIDDSYNLDLADVERHITDKTRAIMAVHLYGNPVDMIALMELANRRNIKVIEDCAQALGTKLRGQPVGSFGQVGCLSFFPSKNLGAFGDGGMVVTSDAEVASQLNLLRAHGSIPGQKYHHAIAGYNSRLDALQAAVLRVKLRHLEGWIEERRRKAERYYELMSSIPGVEMPTVTDWGYHSFNYYTIRLDQTMIDRDGLQAHLTGRGVATAIYYPLALHQQPAFKNLGYEEGDLPVTEKVQREVISLPMYPELRDLDQETVAGAIREYAGIKAAAAL